MTSVVLVTGGAGFIGSHLVDRLLAAGRHPRILDTRVSEWHHPSDVETVLGDVRRVDDVLRAARGCAAICHLAAVADVAQVRAEPARSTELNATGTLNVLEAARRLSTPRVVYASTVWVYSDVDADEVDEVDEDTPLYSPRHLYTAGKLAGELYCRSYAELYGVESTIVRFGIPYGPRARPAAVIPAFVARARAGEPLAIAGTGEQRRAFVYVEDLADGVVAALAPAGAGRIYNLAGRETVTIRRLAEIVRDEVAPVEIVHTAGRAGDLHGATIRSDRAEQELGWCATTPLSEGVRRYARWVAAQPPERLVGGTGGVGSPIASLSRCVAGARSVAGRAAAAALEPSRIGFVSLIALVSSLLPALASTREVGAATGVTLLAVMLMVPLWSVTVTEWPVPLRRIQAAIALLFGLIGVGLAATLPPERLGDIGQAHWTSELVFTLLAATALRIVPARLLQERG